MKKTLFVALVSASFLLLNITQASAWGQIGHSTIAQVAQDHLTPKAKKALDKYLDGMPLAILGSDADIYIEDNGLLIWVLSRPIQMTHVYLL